MAKKKGKSKAKRKKKPEPPVTAYPVSPYIIGMDWIELPVREPARSAAVYRSIGFAPRSTAGRYPRLAVGGTVVVLRPAKGGGGDAKGGGGMMIQVAVDHLENKRAQLRELGLKPGPIRVQGRGDRAFVWRDSDGHGVRFVGPARRADDPKIT